MPGCQTGSRACWAIPEIIPADFTRLPVVVGYIPSGSELRVLAGVGTEKITASRWILAADWPIRALAW